jgi:hypothetical protein
MADIKIGEYIKRNKKVMFFPTINTTSDVKSIATDNEYQIIARFQAANGKVYSISSVQTNIRYDVAHCDMRDFFEVIDKATQKELDTNPEVPEAPKPEKKCTCDSLDLFKYGCRCGAIDNEYELRYKSYQQELMGPRMGEDD